MVKLQSRLKWSYNALIFEFIYFENLKSLRNFCCFIIHQSQKSLLLELMIREIHYKHKNLFFNSHFKFEIVE